VSAADIKETVLRFYPDAVFPTDSGTWVTDITYTKSGRVGTLKLGGVTVSGPVLRNMFGLRSTAASVEVGEKTVVFTPTGYGHGVGLSQYGANAFALEGKTYRESLQTDRPYCKSLRSVIEYPAVQLRRKRHGLREGIAASAL
jgi:stage II sporulation protein D